MKARISDFSVGLRHRKGFSSIHSDICTNKYNIYERERERNRERNIEIAREKGRNIKLGDKRYSEEEELVCMKCKRQRGEGERAIWLMFKRDRANPLE